MIWAPQEDLPLSLSSPFIKGIESKKQSYKMLQVRMPIREATLGGLSYKEGTKAQRRKPQQPEEQE